MSLPEAQDDESYETILGIRFFNGTAAGAVEYISRVGGYVVVPAAPALVKLRYDPDFRDAIAQADLAIADSGLMVLLWRFLGHRKIARLSGLTYLKGLLESSALRGTRQSFWIMPSDSAQRKALAWLVEEGFNVDLDDFYVAPRYGAIVSDRELLDKIERHKAKHIIIAIGGGPQEKLGRCLRDNLSYRPAIHCIGAALGFLTGDQVPIPNWADRFYLGWLLRLFAQPRIFIPRLARALELPWLIARYGSELPPLKHRGSDV